MMWRSWVPCCFNLGLIRAFVFQGSQLSPEWTSSLTALGPSRRPPWWHIHTHPDQCCWMFSHLVGESFKYSVCLCRTTEWIYSFVRDGMTLACGFLLTLRARRWLLIPRCSSVCGNQICSSPMRKTQTSTTWHRTTFCSSSSGTEMSWSVWGGHMFLVLGLLFGLFQGVWSVCGLVRQLNAVV